MAEKKQFERITSPRGVAKWPKLTSPDTRFKKEGVYSVDLLLDPENKEVQEFISKIDAAVEESFTTSAADLKGPKAKTLQRTFPYKPEVDEDGNETGMMVVNFKTNAQYTDKKGEVHEVRPALYDAKGNKITRKLNVGSGSVMKVNGILMPYYMANGNKAGVSLRMNAVQIIELKEFGGGDAASYGFGQEEGFEAETAAAGEETGASEGEGDF